MKLSKQQKHVIGVSIMNFVFFAIVALRLRGGILRIPPDPGFDVLSQARPVLRFSFFDIAKHGSYISVIPRIIGKLAAFTPIEYAAVISSLLTLFIWSLSATITFVAIRRIANNSIIALLCGLIVVLNPAAGESSIGNYGNAIWQVYIVMSLVFAIAEFPKKFNIPVYLLALVGGLSHPWAVLTLAPLIGSMPNSNKQFRAVQKKLLLITLFTFGIQIAVFLSTGSSAARTGVTYWWENMPIFWSFNWLFPIALSISVILLNLIISNRQEKSRFTATYIALSALSVAIVCYLQGGIADRYFVAPMTLSVCASAVLACQIDLKWKWIPQFVFAIALILVSVGSYKWFRASSYLNSGPTWYSEVIRIRDACSDQKAVFLEAQLSIGTTEVSCDSL
jgi:hypothetical protein